MTYMQIYNILDNKMTHSTFACRKWYGAHKAVLCLKKLINRETKKFQRDWINEDLYYLKIDFSKYFFSINHQILKDKLRKYIDNEEVLYLLDLIIDSYSTNNRYDSLLKHYDFYINETGKWLPIWGVISQILANFYLNDLDQYIKHKLKLRFVRYMDDVVILWTKNELNFTKNKIMEFIGKEKLILNPQKISFNLVRDWIKFVWYKIKDSKIFVWKKIKKSFLVFTDFLNDMKYRNYNLTLCDVKRIDSMYFSRTWCFKITDFWENFVRCRENTDFLRGGNANNAANAGIFTLNLNRTATNQNRNVGFRCS
jgi:hypothetical protein